MLVTPLVDTEFKNIFLGTQSPMTSMHDISTVLGWKSALFSTLDVSGRDAWTSGLIDPGTSGHEPYQNPVKNF